MLSSWVFENKEDKPQQHMQQRGPFRHLLRSQSEESIGFIQDQVVEAGEEEAAAGEQTHQSEGSGHQQQAWREWKQLRSKQLECCIRQEGLKYM